MTRSAIALLAASLLAPAASADAAKLTTPKSCYGGGDVVRFKGSGFSPNRKISFTVQTGARTPVAVAEQARSDARGVFGLALRAPFTVQQDRRVQTLAASDGAAPAITARRPVKLSIVRIKVRPQSGLPSRIRRIRATGFSSGAYLYAHRIRGSAIKTIRIGRLRGDCHSLSVRARLFARNAKVGKYRIQFDAFRRYRRDRRQKVPFTIEIFKGDTQASAARSGAPTGDGPLRARWRRAVVD